MENGGYVDSDDREKLTKTLSTVENGDRKKRLVSNVTRHCFKLYIKAIMTI